MAVIEPATILQSFKDVAARSMVLYVLGIAIVGVFVARYLYNLFRPGLRNVPGPLFAHLTSLYRIKLVWKGGAVENYSNLHRKYGSIVRTGSNHVSVSDPAMIPLIYGISSKFKKVSSSLHGTCYCIAGS